jgi:hypothetical protein
MPARGDGAPVGSDEDHSIAKMLAGFAQIAADDIHVRKGASASADVLKREASADHTAVKTERISSSDEKGSDGATPDEAQGGEANSSGKANTATRPVVGKSMPSGHPKVGRKPEADSLSGTTADGGRIGEGWEASKPVILLDLRSKEWAMAPGKSYAEQLSYTYYN